jgi:hypothetical protein
LISWANNNKDCDHKVAFDLIFEVTEALNKEPERLNRLYELTVTAIRTTNLTRTIFITPILRSAPKQLKDLTILSQRNDYLKAEWHFYVAGPGKTNEN